jgi:hypothetical protein
LRKSKIKKSLGNYFEDEDTEDEDVKSISKDVNFEDTGPQISFRISI